ncbi:unnamed protein product [Hapterophycus canaliculatus]
MSHGILVNVFEHSHKFFSLGIRLYFGTIPVFAWIFSPWALLAVTPLYLYMVRGLENAGFVKVEMEEAARLRAALQPLPGPNAATTIAAARALEEGPSDKKL